MQTRYIFFSECFHYALNNIWYRHDGLIHPNCSSVGINFIDDDKLFIYMSKVYLFLPIITPTAV